MKKTFGALIITLMSVLALSGCYQQVNPGQVGKKVTPSGIQEQILETGRHMIWWNQRLISIDVATVLRQAPVNVIMADYGINDSGEVEQRIGLDMDFIVNLRYSLKNDPSTINAMMRDMTLDNRVNNISAEQMYTKYGNMIIGRVTREVLGKYTPEEVLDNLDEINKVLQSRVQSAFQETPLVAHSVSLGPIKLPSVITQRIQTNKDTELSESQARAQQRIDLLERQNQIQLARQRAIQEEVDARSLANQNEILASSTTPEVIRLRELENQRLQIEMMREVAGRNGNTIFLPYDAMSSVGAQTRMFNNQQQ